MKAGTISKAHGIKGEIFIKAFNEHPDWPKLQTIFIGEELGLSSFKVESYRPHKAGWIFKIETINSRNESEALVGKFIFFQKDQFTSKEGELFYLSEIEGFSVINKEKEILGLIAGFSLNKNQDLICIQNKEKKIFVPFVSEYITDIQFDKKQLELDLPAYFLEELK